MSEKNLITLTNSPVDFSDGAFQKSYITPLSQSQFDGDELELSWQSELSDSLIKHHLEIKPISTGKRYENFEYLRMRAFCHVLLDFLPEDGLEEIKESLLEAIKFYQEPQLILEPFHLNDSFEVAIGEGYERPVFQIAED